MNIAFKVVRKDNNNILRSATRTGFGCVDYSRTGWIHPNPGASQFLFVFKTREYAEKFLDGRVANGNPRSDYKILPVEIENPQTEATTRLGFSIKACNYPQGTVFCSALRILNKRVAYKVVRVNFGLYSSAVARHSRAVAYKLGKVTKPKSRQNQFLFVFKTLAHAERFMRNRQPFGTIFRVHAYGTSREATQTNGLVAKAIDFPRGTVFCKAVRTVTQMS